MKKRPALIIELKDKYNNIGLGEIWCNFPSDGALYKFNLLKNIFVNKIKNINIYDPSDISKIFLDVRSIFVQSNDLGSYDSILAGFNCALWDLFSKNKKKPLNKLINDKATNKIILYASGINPDEATKSIEKARKLGIKSFKIKIGFNNNLDLNLIKKVILFCNKNESLMFDVNQGWDINNAKKYLKILQKFPIYWIEEPVSALTKDRDYLELINSSKISIALGENISNEKKFINFLKNRKIKFIQPDITKYGGLSFIVKNFNSNINNKLYLHFLGSAVGMITSAHLMSAINKNGLLETDLNTNPLRDSLFNEKLSISNGILNLNQIPGIGFTLNKNLIGKYLVNLLK